MSADPPPRSPSAAKERAYPFEMTRAEIGLAIDGLAKAVDAEHPLLWRLKALYAHSKDLEPIMAADRPPDPADRLLGEQSCAQPARDLPVSAVVSPAEPPEALRTRRSFSDLELTQLQETGSVVVGHSMVDGVRLAAIMAAVLLLGIDPDAVVLHGTGADHIAVTVKPDA